MPDEAGILKMLVCFDKGNEMTAFLAHCEMLRAEYGAYTVHKQTYSINARV